MLMRCCLTACATPRRFATALDKMFRYGSAMREYVDACARATPRRCLYAWRLIYVVARRIRQHMLTGRGLRAHHLMPRLWWCGALRVRVRAVCGGGGGGGGIQIQYRSTNIISEY